MYHATSKGLAFDAAMPPETRVPVSGDGSRLRQVLLNLLGNAMKFTNEGRVSLHVIQSAVPGRWRFEVRDTGIGIADADHQLVFRRFAQVDGSHARRQGGLGLGLAIARHLVELMGGRIGLESKLGSGSVFWFELPLPAVAAETPPAQQSATPRPEHQPHRILLAEDNPVNTKVALWQLRKLGYDVDCAADGRQALEALERSDYSAVLMDCQMPEMDGFEATSRIRQQSTRFREITIIALTANAMTGDRERCLAAGMDDYLPKPLELAELSRVLEKWVTARSSADVPDQVPSSPV
jgi:CheY-like chemotaxis protein